MDAIGVERLGWTLVHFCWQGALIALLYAATRTVLPRRANIRYGLACCALALMMAVPVATWFAMASPDTAAAADRTARVPGKVSPVAMLPFAVETTVPSHTRSVWLEGAVVIWLLGASLLSLRLGGGWARAARLRRKFVRFAPPEWEPIVARLKARIGLARTVGLRVSAMVQSPMVIGAFRPLVLVPVGMLSGLPADQVEALLLHELAHIRRHDYLVHLLQNVIEALLFYHPAVWWVSGHIRTEREHCCDDVAVSAGGSVLTYVNALAELESSRPAHLAAVAATGGSLADRIARLLGQPRQSERNGVARGTVLGAVVLVLVSCAAFAHTDRPEFRSSSVKLNIEHPQAKIVRPLAEGDLMVRNAPLQMIIQNAYGVEPYQVVGGPPWLYSDAYDIDAKPEKPVNKDRTLLMLQTLLADRFKVAMHRETRNAPFFLLTSANGEFRPPAPREDGCVEVPSGPPPIPGTFPCGNVGINMTPSGLQLSGRKAAMSQFVLMLAMVVGRPVINETGFTGQLDPEVRFTSDANTAGLPGSGSQPTDPSQPNILTALQQQMGLKLTPSNGPVEVLVIDRAERPAPAN